MEQLNLSAAETRPTNPNYKIERLTLDWPAATILIQLKGANGEAKSFTYTGAIATTFLTALNKANLTANSLHKRILDRLIADGLLAGSTAGSPD